MKLRSVLFLLFFISIFQCEICLAQDWEQKKNRRREKIVEKLCKELKRIYEEQFRMVFFFFKSLFKEPIEPKFTPKKFGKGSLSIVDGIPILKLKGSNTEMGKQHGVILKEQIKLLQKHFIAHFIGRKRDRIMKVVRKMKKFIPKKYLSELKGLSEGCGRAFDDVLIAHLLLDWYKMSLCSTIACSGKLTKDGNVIFGRNLDFPSFAILHRFSIVIIYQPNDGKNFVSISFPGLTGVLSGMNEDGLSIAINEIYSNKGKKEGISRGFLLRKVLEDCKNVRQAIKVVKRAENTTTSNFTICDGKKNSVVLEVAPEQVVVRKPKKSVLFATNHFVKMKIKHTSIIAYVSSRYRYFVLKNYFRKKVGSIGTPKMIRILSKVAKKFINIQSMIFLPSERELLLSIGKTPAARGEFKRIKPFE